MYASPLHSISMTEVQGCLVVAMQADMPDDSFDGLHQAVTARLVDKRLPAAVLDFSAVAVLDLHEFARIQSLARVMGLLGAQVVFVSLNPGIASFLAQAGADLGGQRFCMHIEDAFALLASRPSQ
jgi:rsbT antagonist protein RsbS